MKALRFHKFAPPSVLAIEEVLQLEPREREVLVQVEATTRALTQSSTQSAARCLSWLYVVCESVAAKSQLQAPVNDVSVLILLISITISQDWSASTR